ncbi:uncharacterized protein LOC130981249 [Arachis stenosperma]|uniref:uncharacterized protein LOC130981249 n=1 Tax=Arachis stenosperma TaxID=217475 RepID=UPI0025AC3B31|nr:uncharacterized protein LOC130981249 [Arachis stenosperma]
MVTLRKNNGKWRMCVDYTDLNMACPKDTYPLPCIDKLVDSSSGFQCLSFMDSYSGATYQRLVDKVFSNQISRNIEVYVDDMVAKTPHAENHIKNLKEIFQQLRMYNMKLNPEKCAFGVQGEKFIGFMLTCRGIEANPEKFQAVLNMRSPKTVKEVQQLSGRLVALSRFLPCAPHRSRHFFKTLRKQQRFEWTKECKEAFTKLKTILSEPAILQTLESGKPLFLYLSGTNHAISSVLVTEIGKQQQPIYFVSKSLQHAEVKYPKLEKLALALPELAGRLIKWSIELSEYDIQYQLRGALKSQALVDFVAEFMADEPNPTKNTWTLYVEGASNNKGSGAGILLEDEHDTTLEQSLQFTFHASNNQAEYEALIAGVKLAHTIGVTQLRVKCDSLLVVQQVTGNFQEEDWRTPLIRYLQTGDIPNDIHNEIKFKRRAGFYTLLGSELYKRGFVIPFLKCLNMADAKLAVDEVHEGICGTHIGGRSLASKILRAGYYWACTRSNTATIVKDMHQLSTTQSSSCVRQRSNTVGKNNFRKMISFVWKHILCRFGIPQSIITDNEHSQTNGLAEVANKIILQGLRKKLEDFKGEWAELIPEVLWSYNTTEQSSTKETPFRLVYGCDAMLPVKISLQTPRTTNINESDNIKNRRPELDLIVENRNKSTLQQLGTKRAIARKYNKKLKPRIL